MSTISLSLPQASRHHRALPPAILAPRTLIIQHPHPRPLSILQLTLILSVLLCTGLLLYFLNTVLLEVQKNSTPTPASTPIEIQKTPRDPAVKAIF